MDFVWNDQSFIFDFNLLVGHSYSRTTFVLEAQRVRRADKTIGGSDSLYAEN